MPNRSDEDWGDNYTVEAAIYEKTILDEKDYDKKYKRYLAAMKKYKIDLEQYKEDKKEYDKWIEEQRDIERQKKIDDISKKLTNVLSGNGPLTKEQVEKIFKESAAKANETNKKLKKMDNIDLDFRLD